MKISLLEPLGIPENLLEALAAPMRQAGHTFVSYEEKTTDPRELIRRAKDSDIVMIANNPFPEAVVQAVTSLKMLDVAFTGIDHVALAACKERGVTVCNAAGYSNQTVAELVIGLTIGLLRHVCPANEAVRRGGTAAGFCGREIAGRTVGIIGTGRIGMITAKLFYAFGAKLLGYSKDESPEAAALGMQYTSLEKLLSQSDIVSLHTPNDPSTKGMINAERIALMKPDALLINCARGPIVDNAALADALNRGAIAGAGIDVFDMEPPIPEDYPLLHAKNTLLTPHIAFLSEESMVRRAQIAFDNVYAFLQGKPMNVCSL